MVDIIRFAKERVRRSKSCDDVIFTFANKKQYVRSAFPMFDISTPCW